MPIRKLIIIALFTLLQSCSNSLYSSKSGTKSGVGSGGGKPPTQWQALEKQIAIAVEKERRARGLKPMLYDARVAKIARSHSMKLAKQAVRRGEHGLTHDGFSSRFNQIVLRLGMQKMGENVAYIEGGASQRAVRFTTMWMASAGHKKNIVQVWNYTGVGVAVTPDGSVYATQLFALKTDFTF